MEDWWYKPNTIDEKGTEARHDIWNVKGGGFK